MSVSALTAFDAQQAVLCSGSGDRAGADERLDRMSFLSSEARSGGHSALTPECSSHGAVPSR